MELSCQDKLVEAGCDEAGRGCLAGPVFAAAVILPPDFRSTLLNDSKKMTPANRNRMRQIIENEAIAWAVATISAERIDEINILNASFEAMTLAVEELGVEPQLLLIDGNMFRTRLSTPFKCVVGGDGLYMNIAAASVLAKIHRDEFMVGLSKEYPGFGWERNKGYPTQEHRDAIRRLGLSPFHRKSFNSGR